MVLLVASQIHEGQGEDTVTYHGITLREEVVCALWTCVLGLGSCEPSPNSYLHRLPAQWGRDEFPGEANDADEKGRGEFQAILSKLHELCVPTFISAYAVLCGDSPDDAVALVWLVCEKKGEEGRYCYMFNQNIVEGLWRILLMGPGGRTAMPGSAFQEFLTDQSSDE